MCHLMKSKYLVKSEIGHILGKFDGFSEVCLISAQHLCFNTTEVCLFYIYTVMLIRKAGRNW